VNPRNLPLAKDASGCHPVWPHSFLRVNTIFEVAKAAGLRTAWSDKHPSYDLVNGPSGKGVDDLYTPEINSLIVNGGVVNGVDLTSTQAKCEGTNSLPPAKVSVYTDCIPAQEAYDDVKVPALERRDLLESTLIVISAKHGQSPIDFSKLAMEGGGHAPVQTVAGHLQTDDVGILWLQNRSESNKAAVLAQLRNNAALIFADHLPDDTIFSESIVSGGAPDDTHVGLLLSLPGTDARQVGSPVETTQVAPTILRALGLDPRALEAVRKEHTRTLPGAPF
jgi:hypothetical protein